VPKSFTELLIDPWELAQRRQRLQGEIAPQSLSRLNAQLTQSAGQILFDWQFEIIEHYVVIVGQLNVQLSLQCQRCLRSMLWETRLETALCPLKPEQESDEQNLPAGYEAIPLPTARVKLGLLIEDEVLLAVPFAPLHEQCLAHEFWHDEAVSAEFEAAQKEQAQANPFQALAALKR